MQPRMSDAELKVFIKYISASRKYLEFGAGGSTCLAARLVAERIVTIDSSLLWLSKVWSWCKANGVLEPHTVFADIGPVAEWGRPTDPGSRFKWPGYHGCVWATENGQDFDLFMVDGRFRVACFMQVLLHCRPGAIVMFHTFASRPQYHVVRTLAEQIDAVEDLAIFRVPETIDRETATRLLAEHAYNYA